jgi:hypothetical protein
MHSSLVLILIFSDRSLLITQLRSQNTVVIVCSICFNIKKSAFCLHSAFMAGGKGPTWAVESRSK